MLFDLLTAANYMAIKPLLDLAVLRVTFELMDKNVDQVRCLRFASLELLASDVPCLLCLYAYVFCRRFEST